MDKTQLDTSPKMTRYTNADFADDDSVNSVQLNEGISSSATHIRYHAGSSIWKLRSPLEKVLLLLVAILLFTIFILAIVLHITEHKLQESKPLLQPPTIYPNGTLIGPLPCLTAAYVDAADGVLRAMAPGAVGAPTGWSTTHVGGAPPPSPTPLPQPPTIYPNGTLIGPLPCLTAACVHAADGVLRAMAPGAVGGPTGWTTTHVGGAPPRPLATTSTSTLAGMGEEQPPPTGKTTWGTFMRLEQDNQMVIVRILEQPIETLKSKAEQKAKMYYESCLDSNDTVEQLGARPMQDLLIKLGGWNVTNSGFNVDSWTLQNITQTVQNRYNIGGLFSYAVGEDDRNSTRHVLQIDQNGLTLPTRDYYLNHTKDHEKVVNACLEYMVKVGILLGGEPNSTKQQMKDVMDFETRLANITIPNELRRDEEQLYNLMTVQELQELAPFLDWRMFFEDAMRIVRKKIDKKEPVVVYAPEYLKNLTGLIKEYNSTRTGRIILNNYMVWQAIRVFSVCLSKAFRDAYKGFRIALTGSEGGEEPQWRYCIQDTNSVLGFAIGAIFVREVFNQDSKIQAEEMINNVRNAFKKNFKNLKWMDEETRQVAIAKADAISDMIGYPDFIKDINQLDERFESLNVRNDSYFENNIQISQYNLRKNLEKINEAVNKTSWSMPPSTVNAYYTPTKNQMVFPAGILQAPFYSPAHPDALNYGAMGVVMGHELTHAFDDQGRQFDRHGNLKHWWKNETVERFKERTKCVVDQYNKYKINGKSINGNQTLGENIADNGGLKAAYHAYLELMKDKPEPPPLPGIPLSHKQLFFVAFAQVWCSAITKEATNLQIEKDSHSPAQYRVIGALSNLKEFSQEFNCKAGSKMNPAKKCEVW